MGVIPGKYYNTSQDRVLVVGAHWDTFGVSPGFNDNGSGVAALLDIARVLGTAACYQPDYTVFFVAFDAEESGCRGSQEFVSSHLWPHLRATGGTSQGAFILDTILNFDSRKNSQQFSKVSVPRFFANHGKTGFMPRYDQLSRYICTCTFCT